MAKALKIPLAIIFDFNGLIFYNYKTNCSICLVLFYGEINE